MRCFYCEKYAFSTFCTSCERELASFTPSVRVLKGGFKVYYFYKFDEIKELIHSKHKLHGSLVFKALAKLSFANFKHYFPLNACLDVLPLDDRAKGSFSHTALLAKYLKSPFLKPLYHCLHSSSNLRYQGQSLSFREKNKRKYKLLKRPKNPVILVDDIVTSGLSIQEAKSFLEKRKLIVLFALVLADAS